MPNVDNLIHENLKDYVPIPNYKNIRELKLPQIPQDIVDRVIDRHTKDPNSYAPLWDQDDLPMPVYYQEPEAKIVTFSDSFNEEIDQWCKDNICDSIKWDWQILSKDLPIHRDFDADTLENLVLHTKFFYLITPGGDNVVTNFFNSEDPTDIIETYVIKTRTWYLFNAARHHNVVGIEPGKTRFTMVGNTF